VINIHIHTLSNTIFSMYIAFGIVLRQDPNKKVHWFSSVNISNIRKNFTNHYLVLYLSQTLKLKNCIHYALIFFGCLNVMLTKNTFVFVPKHICFPIYFISLQYRQQFRKNNMHWEKIWIYFCQQSMQGTTTVAVKFKSNGSDFKLGTSDY
jgi:hypothetical protein